MSTPHIYGYHPVIEALESGTSVDKILLRKGHKMGRVTDLARELGIPVQAVPDVTLDRLSRGANHQGVMATVAAFAYKSLEDILLKLQEESTAPLIVALDGVTDVRNFGAIARTAECMGAHALVVPARGSAAANGAAVKASAGALYHLPVCRVDNLTDAVLLLQAYDVEVVACTEKAEADIYQIELPPSCCLVMGSEEKGISTQVLNRSDSQVKIPLYGQVDSLNVSVAAGIALAEARRQRSAAATT